MLLFEKLTENFDAKASKMYLGQYNPSALWFSKPKPYK